MPKKSLIYIIGAGRSGTTLLDIILGNAEGTISMGEINRFFKRKGIPPKRDPNDKVFKFWEGIRTDFESKSNDFSYTDLRHLFKKNEYHSHFFKSVLKKNELEYISHLRGLYDVIFNRTAEECIIESSKYPLRALNLSNYLDSDKVELSFVYLKKDPVDVIRSFGRKNLEQPSKGFLSANLYYLIVNLICEVVYFKLKKKHKACRIKFEDLVSRPDEALNKIENSLQIKLKTPRTIISSGNPMNTGFLFDGNRIRLKESLLLQTRVETNKKSPRDYITRILNFIIYRP